jgi:hypothetical protein
VPEPHMVCSACGRDVVRHEDDSWGHVDGAAALACADGRGDRTWVPVEAEDGSSAGGDAGFAGTDAGFADAGFEDSNDG